MTNISRVLDPPSAAAKVDAVCSTIQVVDFCVSGSYQGLQAADVRHIGRTQPTRTALRRGAWSVVPLADRAIGTLQQWLTGTYHGVSMEQLPVYLDEFVFRHNRRRQPMAAFQTMLGLGSSRAPTADTRIRGARDLAGDG